ncbi:amidohydrolase family protein [Methylotenera sp.]|uniref:amidohydrolase family protein n=1 Tax=Methylotenera sp. TaxID=2051956 RepID=UPI00248A1BFD|nr:amidohydrolase family protein [Methylotenera sp.]MDI1298881.1 amidohydrolase family protein [Methylotenera sp.]
MNRRQFLLSTAALGLSGSAVASIRLWPESGFTNPCLSGLPDELKNHPLMTKIWTDIDASQVWDCHAHIIGAGDSGSGAWFNPNMESWMHPILKVQKNFYMNGGCIVEHNEDASFVTRMTQLAGEMPSGYKTMLFAFDWFRDEQGVADSKSSIFHVPNEYAAKIANQYPQYFEWVASIHPYRPDAIDALEKAHSEGARAIKWLPTGMNIDPASSKCAKFYQKLHDLDMPIISHTGRESAVKVGNQAFGNPLKMRKALDSGVRVVLAHCASDGYDEDLDHQNVTVKSFDLFTRMMDTPAYQNLVFGEISAITLFNHAWVIKPLLARTDWHSRLLNGTDYPLPAILPLVSTKQLCRDGLLEESHLLFLQTLRNYNPLMFDFAVKRLMQWQGVGFSKEIFETRRVFDKKHTKNT